MLSRLWSFLTGYVSLVIEGRSLEKLINMAVGRGLYLWDIKWVSPGRAKVKVRLNGIRALRHIARRTQCRFKITGKIGLPFRLVRIRKSKVLLAGAVLSVLLIYVMSSFIWFVEVKGNKVVPPGRVISTAEEAGLAMGTVKVRMNKDEIEKYIRKEIPEVSWVGIKVTGTKAVIEIAEKVIVPPIDSSPANVVAEKAGLIQQLLVYSGKAAVNEGDMVKQGDVIISGVIRPEPKPEDQQQGETIPPEPVKIVRARGIVRAKVWYEGYGECRFIEVGTRRTGKQAQVLSLWVFGKELVLKGPESPPFQDFVTGIEVKNLVAWRNIRIPVEIVTTNYYEVQKYRDIINISDAYALANKRALAEAKGRVPVDAAVTREISEEIQTRGSNVVRVKVIIEAVEEIGRTEPLRQEDKLPN
ncbi:MAG: sporulation protein YqfD [Firmicutes bacterium HGW-Firmicutes-8]|nr:MAG: sporulation protein YqfD [Firmicutes bacterium HGW-Firmicutes-8]